MPRKTYYTVPTGKYKKDYIKKNKKVLFVYDKEVSPGKKDYFDLPNVIGIDFSDIVNDKNMPENEKIIKKELSKIQSKSKKFEKVGIPTGTIGLKLVIRKANQSYKVLSYKLRKYENTVSLENKTKKNNNTDFDFDIGAGLGTGLGSGRMSNKKNEKGKTKKKTSKQLKELEERSKRKILQPLKDSKKECHECNDSMRYLKKSLYPENTRESKMFIKGLSSKIGKCKQCIKKCSEVKDLMKHIKKNKALYQVQYPLLCKLDPTGKSKARRIKDDLNETLIAQHKILNQE